MHYFFGVVPIVIFYSPTLDLLLYYYCIKIQDPPSDLMKPWYNFEKPQGALPPSLTE